MYNTKANQQLQKQILNNSQKHLQNLMDLEDGENEIRKKKLQLSGGFLPFLLPLLGSLFGKGHSSNQQMAEEGYMRDEGVIPLKKKANGRLYKGSGFLSNMGIPVISNIAGLFGLGKNKKQKKQLGLGISGGDNSQPKKRAPSAWIEHVKNYAKTNNILYKDALSQAKASYKK